MLTKDVASAYVIARRGLGLRERIPKVYRDLLNKLQNNLDAIKELKEYVKEKVKNAYLKAKQLKLIDLAIKSLKSELRRVSRPKVVVLTALSPGRVLYGHKLLLQGAGAVALQYGLFLKHPAAGDDFFI